MFRAALLVAFVSLMPAGVRASADLPINGIAGVDVLTGFETPEGRMIAARIRLAQGWKTYWRAPGGNGIPPRIDWGASSNLSSSDIFWPAPGVYTVDGVRTIGFVDELVLPILLTPLDPTQPITLSGRLSFGVCEDICVPVEADLSAVIEPGAEGSVAVVRGALARGPATLPEGSATCFVEANADGAALRASIRLAATAGRFIVVEYADQDVWVDPDPTTADAQGLHTQATFYALGDDPLIVDPARIRLTVLGGAQAQEIIGCPAG